MPDAMIEVSDLAFRYPGSKFRLSIDHLTVEAGHCAALIGPSGCGKTTLLHLIAGIIPSQSGAVHVNANEIDSLNDAERRLFRVRDIGVIFQDFALLDYPEPVRQHPSSLQDQSGPEADRRGQAARAGPGGEHGDR